jgi:DNA mismatch endonuclease (patch repair protein)
MSRVRTKGTDLETGIAKALRRRGIRFSRNPRGLPGSPDIVLHRPKVAVFIDGDFWHGYRFPVWRAKMSPFWRAKIAKNRVRDARNFRKLRRAGWRVIRIWQHQWETDEERCVERIVLALEKAGRGRGPRRVATNEQRR